MSGPLEEMRRRWDPMMAGQIAAHATLLYPWEAPDPTMIAGWVEAATGGVAAFRLRLGALSLEDGWCGYAVDDVDGGMARVRARVDAPGFTPGTVPPHVTVVHPRTSKRGAEAYAAWRDVALDLQFTVSAVAITAWDGGRWATLETIPLAGPSRSG